jgi:very-short-patch-repair endonuclease
MISEEATEIVVTVSCHRRPVVDWIRLYQVKVLPRGIRRLRDEIPVTSPSRTLVDLAVRPDLDLEGIWLGAFRRGLASPREVEHLLSITPTRGKAGIARLRRLLRRHQWTDGELERRAMALFKKHGIPPPRCQYPVSGVGFVDFAWPQVKVLVEADGFGTHSGHEAWTRDLARHNALVLLGWRTLRMTWDDATRNGHVFVHRLKQLLRPLAQGPELLPSERER